MMLTVYDGQAVIAQDILGDPEVARADDPPHSEAFPVRLCGARRLNLQPAADTLAGLRIFEHCVLSVNLVLGLEVAHVRGSPVSIQSSSNLSVFHIGSPDARR